MKKLILLLLLIFPLEMLSQFYKDGDVNDIYGNNLEV